MTRTRDPIITNKGVSRQSSGFLAELRSIWPTCAVFVSVMIASGVHMYIMWAARSGTPNRPVAAIWSIAMNGDIVPAASGAGKPLSPAELAALHNVTESIIRKRCREGKLVFFRVGKHYRFPAEFADCDEVKRVLLAAEDGGPSSFYRRNVYFIGSEIGPIKIGMAIDVGKRLISLQACSPCKLSVLATTTGGIKAERIYHRQFTAHRLHGEWFNPAPEILAEIGRLNQSPVFAIDVSEAAHG